MRRRKYASYMTTNRNRKIEKFHLSNALFRDAVVYKVRREGWLKTTYKNLRKY
jgi:hypothetical protein